VEDGTGVKYFARDQLARLNAAFGGAVEGFEQGAGKCFSLLVLRLI
jgi:hypothetical protein